MSLFCGKKCKCKKRCDEYFTSQIDEFTFNTSSLAPLCHHACKRDKNITPEAFLQTLTPEQIAPFQDVIPEMCQGLAGQPWTFEEIMMSEGVLDACLPYAEQAHQKKKQQDFVKLALIVTVLIIAIIIFYKSK